MSSRVLASFVLVVALAGCRHMGAKDVPPRVGAIESRVTEVKALDAVSETLAESGSRKTLLVLDIDDTLLTSQVFFGSDRWYEWQKRFKAGDAAFVPCKFDVIALNYEAGTQRATEPESGPTFINELAVDKLLLTARNPGYRGGTMRELLAAGYTPPSMLGDRLEGLMFRWQPTPESKPIGITYQDGVMMVSGQDKGKLLMALLERIGARYDRVILIDDGRKNIDQMQAALLAASIDYHGLWYTRIDKTISAEDERVGQAAWTAMQTWLENVFPERLQRIRQGTCYY